MRTLVLLSITCIIVLVMPLSPICGYSIRDKDCGSYKTLLGQYYLCKSTSMPSEDMEKRDEMLRDKFITQSEAIELLKIYCRSIVPSKTEKSCFRLDCASDTENSKLLSKWGGVCDGDANLLPQVVQLLSGYSLNWTRTCGIWYTQRTRKNCPGSEDPKDRLPDSSLNIQDGISWWESTRTTSIKCSVKALSTTPPTTCSRSRDFQIFTIIAKITNRPLGIGAHIDVGQFLE